jgi:uncharacterized RDD family membrane protein YckC
METTMDYEPSKKQIVYATFNARLIANIIDIFIFMIILLPITNLIQIALFGDVTPQSVLNPILLESLEKLPNDPGKRFDYVIHHPKFVEYFVINKGFYKMLIDNLLMLFIAMILFVISWIYTQTSPGKMLMSLKIIDAKSYGPPSKIQYIIRFLGYMIFFGAIWMFFNKRKQALHDIFAGTLVVKK